MSAVLRREGGRYATGAPKAPPVWQLVCEFANGACVCAHQGRDEPCAAVVAIDQRIRNRVMADIAETHHLIRKGRR